MSDPPVAPRETEIDPPPFLKTWSRLYLLVLTELAVCIVLFFLFTEAWS